jgi:hypothetical protein
MLALADVEAIPDDAAVGRVTPLGKAIDRT